MAVEVLYFAACRAAVGMDAESVELAGMTVADAVAALVARHAALAPIVGHCRVAVNQDFVASDAVVPDGAEFVLIPPVAGGDERPPRVVAVLDRPLEVDDVLPAVCHPGAGAEVVMVGTVRDHHAGESVTKLVYEAYAPMAEKVFAAILDGIEAEFAGVRTSVVHRTGELMVGEHAVIAAASAPHRQDAFLACQAIIDRLKADAPIWKHEHRASGEVWVGLGP